MREQGILFQPDMVRAILAGQKTQTRRQREPGDRLWVREAWRTLPMFDGIAPRDLPPQAPIRYEADQQWRGGLVGVPGRLRPGMFMCRWMARLVLCVDGRRRERLQQISEADCVAEGAAGGAQPGYSYNATPAEHYRLIWDRINGAKPALRWNANPLIWVAVFHVEQRP